ncbi:DNA/RNA polymerases superfamily protein [Gossypium australe]|uniref:DNA/RNA polymerases superfamily protein n=1 Tax=Gossypium australe TaxID=47621 RepID=A0A5B6WDX3_9ROSI|nr:DNA/RNA polymerases superfamily protein [Gossypium australe]
MISAQKMISRGCEAFLAYVLDTRDFVSKLDQVLPPEREVEFSIDLVPETIPISIPPYIMALTELKELQAQLQELLDRCFICPSVFPWDSSLRLCIDYQQQNKVTVKNNIHCLVKNCNVMKTTFRTRYGYYKFLVMPFRIHNRWSQSIRGTSLPTNS